MQCEGLLDDFEASLISRVEISLEVSLVLMSSRRQHEALNPVYFQMKKVFTTLWEDST